MLILMMEREKPAVLGVASVAGEGPSSKTSYPFRAIVVYLA